MSVGVLTTIVSIISCEIDIFLLKVVLPTIELPTYLSKQCYSFQNKLEVLSKLLTGG